MRKTLCIFLRGCDSKTYVIFVIVLGTPLTYLNTDFFKEKEHPAEFKMFHLT